MLIEGAETWQAAGRVKALVTLSVTPNCALFLKASQIHSASVFSTVLSPEQQEPSGFFVVLPLVTNERQSAKFNTRLEQSAAGAGAEFEADWTVVKTAKKNITKKSGSFKELWTVVLENCAIRDRKGEPESAVNNEDGRKGKGIVKLFICVI